MPDGREEGVEMAFEEKPYPIVRDIMKPGKGEREVTRLIRANTEFRDFSILAATVHFQESDLKSLLERLDTTISSLNP